MGCSMSGNANHSVMTRNGEQHAIEACAALQSSPSPAMMALRATELPWVVARRAVTETKVKLGVSENPPVCRKEEVWIATIARQCGKEIVEATHSFECDVSETLE